LHNGRYPTVLQQSLFGGSKRKVRPVRASPGWGYAAGIDTTLAPPAGDGPRACARLNGEPASARAARRFVADTLSDWSCGHLADDAALLVSELVTNAVIHARSDVALRLWRTGSGIRVEIADRDPKPVVRRPADPEALGGRGLYLVDTLARDWGVRPAKPGKAVWFELGV
jgi:anti-sigma regulatory factor (Ser/Thr protein kinase)